MNNLFKCLCFLTFILGLIACSENEPSQATVNVTKVGNYFQDTQGLHYRIRGNGVVVAKDMYDHGYQHLPNAIKIPANIKYEKETYPVIGIVDNAFDYNSTLDSVHVSSQNQYLADKDGILYNKDISKLIYYPVKRYGNSFVIPATIKSIGRFAFMRNKNIHVIDFSHSVVSVETEAFWGCDNLSEIKNYSSIEYLDTACFGYTKIENINLPNIKEIKNRAFLGCDYLKEIHLGSYISSIYDNCLCIENSTGSGGMIRGLESYYIEANNPPTIIVELASYYRYREECEPTLYVQAESIDSYKEVMGTYFHKIEPIQ